MTTATTSYSNCDKRVGNSFCNQTKGHSGACRVTAHTPGPWIAECVGASDAGPNPTDIYEVATVNGQRRVCEYLREYDARLIATAPEMLAALQDLAQIAREYVAQGIPRLDAAIEKAAFVALKARGEVL